MTSTPSRHAAALAAALLALAGCSRREPLFESLSPRRTGIRFENALQEDDSVYNPHDYDYFYNGAGVGVGDFDGDGRPDLFFAGNMVSSRLYLNRGGMRFRDVTEEAGVGTRTWVTGVTVADVDGDGRPDLYLSVGGPPGSRAANLLFVNLGPDARGVPRFREEARARGVADEGYATHAVFFDYDRDGDLDLYVLRNEPGDQFRSAVRPKRTRGEASSTDRLYRNDGTGHFADVSREAGITVEGYGLGVAAADLDQDGWVDLYVTNDFLSNDLVWINDHDGTFTDRAAEYLKHQSYNAMGNDVADADNDGRPDLVAVDMLPPGNERRKLMLMGGSPDNFQQALAYGYQPEYVRNTFQINDGPGPTGRPSFSDVGELMGVEATDWSWAPLLADFDDDGRKDLFVSNGYRRDVTNLDYVARRRESAALGAAAPAGGVLAEIRRLPEVKLGNYVFQNRGDLTMVDRSHDWGVDEPGFSNGAAYADLDGDGDLDLVLNDLDGPAEVLENHAERLPYHHYLRVALRGPSGNPQGFGAKLRVWTDGAQQYQELSPYRGYQSSVEPVAHFGLGARALVDSLQVYWPDGAYQVLRDVRADRVLVLSRSSARERRHYSVARPAPLFRAATLDGLALRHEHRDLPEFRVTPLLPHRLSQEGPGLAVGDVDGNGLDDVYPGTDRGAPKVLYLQDRPGHFVPRTVDAGTGAQDMGALLFDADGDGRLDLYVVSGGSFGAGGDDAYEDRLYRGDGRGGFSRVPGALPPGMSSGSGVVAADYDGDGDLDLFVGGRVDPGRYPLPPRSYLLRNDGRPGGPPRFTDVTARVAPALERPGLVTDALWTDFDGDGAVDLLVVGEWMPIRFFRNVRGRLEEVTRATGLGDTRGWWSGLAAGDFDDDGDVDYLVGNVGLNTLYSASPSEPIEIWAADFDGNGSVDPVITAFIAGTSHPVASRDVMVAQMMGMRARFPGYGEYARATLSGTLSREERDSAYHRAAVRLASAYLENLGGGRFRLRELPRAAQISPIYGMRTGDFDGDGHLDALVVGNSYAPDTQTGWYDASVGGVLLGDGRGGFRFENGAASGFFVDGDARALAEASAGDHDVFLATQNGDSLRSFVLAAPRGGRSVALRPDDRYALLTLRDGRVRREELPYGSGYLSQSARRLRLPAGTRSAVIHDGRGGARSVAP